MKLDPIREYLITPHARFEMERRRIGDEAVRAVLASPEQRLIIRPGRDVLQSRFQRGAPEKTCLLRVFVDVDREPAEVVTVYATSKVTKYWEEQQ